MKITKPLIAGIVGVGLMFAALGMYKAMRVCQRRTRGRERARMLCSSHSCAIPESMLIDRVPGAALPNAQSKGIDNSSSQDGAVVEQEGSAVAKPGKKLVHVHKELSERRYSSVAHGAKRAEKKCGKKVCRAKKCACKKAKRHFCNRCKNKKRVTRDSSCACRTPKKTRHARSK